MSEIVTGRQTSHSYSGVKRDSLDSGYADSNESNIGIYDAPTQVSSAKILTQSNTITDSVEVQKKQELEKMCEKCHRKMSVKFDFNKMETEGDPEAWVVFNCSMCATPICDSGEESE